MSTAIHARILALDLATVTGWAVSASGVVTSGSQDFSRYQGSRSRPAEHVGEPFAMFHRWLQTKLSEDKPKVIACEGVGFFKSAAAVERCVGLRGILLMQAAKAGIPVFSYSPTTVKKFWAGKGNADKDEMIAATLVRCPDVDLTDGNEADALAIMHLHLSL